MIQISVIIPSYKPGAYIYKCLDSLCGQTLNKSLFEVIVVLNASEKSHVDMLQSYFDEHCNVNSSIIETSIPGVSHARNLALDRAQGLYIYFLDDDDYISSCSLEDLLSRSDGKSLVVSDFRTFTKDEDTTFGKDYVSSAFGQTGNNSLFVRRSFLSSCCGKLIHRSMIGKRRFNEGVKNSEDALFMFTISDKISGIELASSDTCYFRRLRSVSASRRKVSYTTRLKRFVCMAWLFSKVYLGNPFRYNFWLYLSRVIAVFLYNLKHK